MRDLGRAPRGGSPIEVLVFLLLLALGARVVYGLLAPLVPALLALLVVLLGLRLLLRR